MSLTESLKWRYAVKKYSEKEVSEADVNTIVEAINLSATSTGLQPYRVIVVENPDVRKKLAEGSFNQQITEASHLLVFAAIENLSVSHIDEYMARMAETRGVPVESLDKFRQLLVGAITSRTPEENLIWATKQAYIGLGTALAAASEMHIDSTPMEGFIPAKFDAILGLPEKGLKSVVLLALGYRDAEKDPNAHLAKVRLPVAMFSSLVK